METRKLNGIAISAALAGMLALGGCASSSPRPANEKLSQAELAVSLAQRSNAVDFAALELRLAEDNLQKAKGAMEKREFDQAQRFAEQALADAQLAQAKAQAAAANNAKKDVSESIETLKKEVKQQ